VPPPLGPGGTTAFITVLETNIKEVAGVEPKVTAVAFVKPEPVMTTLVPPAVGPLVGFITLIIGPT
jgi:hypothetical protein